MLNEKIGDPIIIEVTRGWLTRTETDCWFLYIKTEFSHVLQK